ncbi:MAG: glycine betaine ABC transporter substrate-binding protein [Actinomycetes bacterium]
MIQKKKATVKASVLAAAAALLLSACGGAGVDAEASAAPAEEAAMAACGSYAIAMHAWVGYTASAQVVTEIAKANGCDISQVTLAEAGVTYDAMEAGSVDLIIEDWGGGRWQEWADRGAVVEVGNNGNIGLIGMFVPQWMADENPDITDSANLNKYADLFITDESKGKGAWYEGPPGYTTIGEKMISANKLNFTVISTGSEQALIDVFTKAAADKTAAIGYFYEPQNFLAKVPLARIKFPANDWTDAAVASGLTDYPESPLMKLATPKVIDANDAFTKIVKNFTWTNADQNAVAADIESGTDPAVAAQKWIDANADAIAGWLK